MPLRMGPFLGDQNCALARLQLKDAELFYSLIQKNRGRLQKIFPWMLLLQSPEDVQTLCQGLQKSWDEQRSFYYLIQFRTFTVGCFSVQNLNFELRTFEMGYWIDADFEGLGLVKRAVRIAETEMLRQGFAEARIRLESFNTASRRVAQRSGYQPQMDSDPQYELHVRKLYASGNA